MVVQESQQRRLENSQPVRTPQTTPLHHHPLQSSTPSHVPQPGPALGSQSANRPGLDRAHTFPTPPASASSLMGITNPSNTYDWSGHNMNSGVSSSQPLSIDTGLSNARSMPTTPATTPPLHSLPSYPSQSSYDTAKPYYSAAPSSHSQYAPQPSLAQTGLTAYGQSMPSSTYMKSDMGPPSGRTAGVQADNESDVKSDRYVHHNGPVGGGAGDSVPEHEPEYVHDNGSGYGTNRGSYTYTTNPSVSSLTGEHSHLGSDIAVSPSQQNGGGRMTPRSSNTVSSQWASGYSTPPRPSAPSALYSMVSDARSSAANGSSADPYSVTSNSAPAYPSTMNGSLGSNKRLREDDEVDRFVRSDCRGTEFDHKRRKTLTEAPVVGGPVGGESLALQPLKPVGLMSRHR